MQEPRHCDSTDEAAECFWENVLEKRFHGEYNMNIISYRKKIALAGFHPVR